MFLSLAGPSQAMRLASLFEREWSERLRDWERARSIVLFDEVRGMLTRAAAAWAGVPLNDAEARLRTREFSEMIEATGSVGPRNWRALLLRERCERWARGVVAGVRAGDVPVPHGCALGAIAAHKDLDGQLLSVKIAAIELLNVLRAVVAVARFIVFAACALHQHPEARRRIASADERYLHDFVQEVRRLSPFFAIIGGRVRSPFEWRGHSFAKGTWVLLDLYGTNRDPRSWEDPAVFRPERFRSKAPSAFDFVPQGAGDASVTHRCPGEELTVHLMRSAVRLLTSSMQYDVPDQDLSVDMSRIPALPKSGFVMSNPRRVASLPDGRAVAAQRQGAR
jgi:fatty-acid peroxygenase